MNINNLAWLLANMISLEKLKTEQRILQRNANEISFRMKKWPIPPKVIGEVLLGHSIRLGKIKELLTLGGKEVATVITVKQWLWLRLKTWR